MVTNDSEKSTSGHRGARNQHWRRSGRTSRANQFSLVEGSVSVYNMTAGEGLKTVHAPRRLPQVRARPDALGAPDTGKALLVMRISIPPYQTRHRGRVGARCLCRV